MTQASNKSKDLADQLKTMEVQNPEELCEHIANFATTLPGKSAFLSRHNQTRHRHKCDSGLPTLELELNINYHTKD